MAKISIIIPAYNEEKRIAKTLDSYIKYFNKRYSKNFNIFVILNGCKDNTLSVVKKYKKNYNNIIYYKDIKEPIGKGGAVIEGFKLAENDVIGFVDADNSTDPEAFNDLVLELEKKHADCVIASRYIKGAMVKPKQSPQRIIGSRGFNFLVRILFNINVNDTQCGAKVFKKKSLKEILPYLGLTRWAFDVDLLYQLKRKKRKILEIPTKWHDEKGSNFRLGKQIPEMFLAIARLRLMYSPLKFIIKFYDKMPESIKIHHRLR